MERQHVGDLARAGTQAFSVSKTYSQGMRSSGVTIVAIMKNEQLFLQEWLDHHIALGIKKFILFKHDRYEYEFHIPGYVTVQIIDYSMRNSLSTQVQAYNEAASVLTGETVAMIDIDEFICVAPEFQKKLDTKKPVIEAAFEYFNVGALALSWMNMSAGGKVQRPAGGVKESYLSHCPKVRTDFNFKSIYRLNRNIVWESAHRAREDCELYDTDKNIVKRFTTGDLYDKIYIKHYITKSWEDYTAKLKR